MNFVITYETLIQNLSEDDMKILSSSGIDFYIISKQPKKYKYSIWFFCIINGLRPVEIFTSKYLFKSDEFSYRDAIIKIQKKNNNQIILVTDDINDKNLIRDLKNITIQNFNNFKIVAEQKRIKSIKPFT